MNERDYQQILARVQGLERELQRYKSLNGDEGSNSRRLSDQDAARAAATKARDRSFSEQTGGLPLGGQNWSARMMADRGRRNTNVGAPIDTVSVSVPSPVPRPDGEDSSSIFYHPFKVLLTDTSVAASPKCAIIAESRLYTALSPSAAATITALTTEITLTATTKIWLKGTVSSLATTAAAITTTNPTDPITVSGSSQTEYHVLIGKVASGSNSDAPGFDFTISGAAYHFEQTCFSHLLVENRCNNGVPAIYPFAFTGV